MKLAFVIVLLSLTSFLCDVDGNPCDGDVFSLGCKIFELIKNKSEKTKQKIEEKFDSINQLRQNDTKKLRLIITDNVHNLAAKEEGDIKRVTEMVQDKLKLLEDLNNKLLIINGKIDNKTESLSKHFGKKIATFESSLSQQLLNTSSRFKREVKMFKTKVFDYINITRHVAEQEFVKMHKEVGKKYVTIEKKLDDEINKTIFLLTKKITNNTKIYERGIGDLKIRLAESIKNVSASGIEKELVNIKKTMDLRYKSLKEEIKIGIVAVKSEVKGSAEKDFAQRYATLREEIHSNVSDSANHLRKTIESEMNTKYHSLKKELNDNIAVIAKELVKDIRSIKEELDAIKKEKATKEWPSGQYCVFKVGHWCPPDFYSHYYKGVYYCCHKCNDC